MFKIKKITVQNFRGFGEKVAFDFQEKPLVLFFAPNGTGKTSLLDAIEWCLTGDIKRLHYAYLERNSTVKERELKLNEETILKNKNHLDDSVEVIMEILIKETQYVIHRIQNQDTLDDPGEVSLLTATENKATISLNEVINEKNFYKYHICDMQKTYRFLYNSRDEMSEEFIDFSTNFDDVECLIENLNYFCDDIDKKIKKIETQKIPEEVINGYNEQLQRLKNSLEVFPYALQKIYPDENVEIATMDENELKQQFLILQGIGYKKILDILEKKKVAKEAAENIKKLEILRKEYYLHKKEIKRAIEFEIDKKEVLQQAVADFEKKNQMLLTVATLEGNSETIIAFNSNYFTRKYWETTNKEINKVDEIIREINSEIEVLIRGNTIIEILTSIVAGKESLIAYRNEERKKGTKILCPVCGSEEFDLLNENDIAKQAQCYQTDHKELIEEKKKKLNELEMKKKNLQNEQFERAVAAKKEAIDLAKDRVNLLTSLYNNTKEFFEILRRLQAIDENRYSLIKMSSEEGQSSAERELENLLISKEQREKDEEELEQIFSILGASYDKTEEVEKIMMKIKPMADMNPEGAKYDRELLGKKIASFRTHMAHLEYQRISNLLTKNKEKNRDCAKQIEELKELLNKANKHSEKIKQILKKLREEEFQQVGPYLYKIFRKLSRNVKIEGLSLKSGKKGGQLSLTDENGKSVLNMFSDGQLSVFMLSYFFGNALRIKETECFPVYFIDDITSCLDDINMLAFLDFIKYQLSNKEGAFEQLFFATCDTRIQDMLCWKMDSCGIPYKRIDASEFERNGYGRKNI